MSYYYTVLQSVFINISYYWKSITYQTAHQVHQFGCIDTCRNLLAASSLLLHTHPLFSVCVCRSVIAWVV